MLGRYNIAISNKKETYSLHHHVGKDHKKPMLSFYIGHNCPKIKGKSIYVDNFLNPVEWMLTEPGGKS
jgi:hypothetical protein